MPLGYAKRVLKQIQLDTCPETTDASETDADFEDAEEADEEDEEREPRSKVNTIAKAMELNTKAFLKASTTQARKV